MKKMGNVSKYIKIVFNEAIEHLFYEFTGVINPRGMLEEHEKSL